MEAGFIFENFDKLGPTPVMDDRTLDFYASEFAKTGMHQTREYTSTPSISGHLGSAECWYSSFEQNFKDERA